MVIAILRNHEENTRFHHIFRWVWSTIFIWLLHQYCIKRLCVRCWQELCIFRFLVTLVWQIPTEICYFLCIHLYSLITWTPAPSHSTVLQLIPQRHGPYWTYYANTHLGLWKCQSHHHNTCSIFIPFFQTTVKIWHLPILKTSRSCTLVSDLTIMPTPIKVGSIQLCRILVCVCACVCVHVCTPTYTIKLWLPGTMSLVCFCPITVCRHHMETEKCTCSNIKSGKVQVSYTREFKNQINYNHNAGTAVRQNFSICSSVQCWPLTPIMKMKTVKTICHYNKISHVTMSRDNYWCA